jgi:hypothetical protein
VGRREFWKANPRGAAAGLITGLTLTVSARLLRELERVSELRSKIAGATIQVSWIRPLQKDSRERGPAHILAPLLKTKLVKRIGTRKSGRYILG